MSDFFRFGCVAVITDPQDPAALDWPTERDDSPGAVHARCVDQWAALRDAHWFAQAERVIRLEGLTPRMVGWIREEASRVYEHPEDEIAGGASWVETSHRLLDALIDRLARRRLATLVAFPETASDSQMASLARYAREDQLALCGRLARAVGFPGLCRAFESGSRAASVMGDQVALRLLLVTP